MLNKALTQSAAALLPGARIEATDLNNGTDIKLYLLNQDYPQNELSQKAMISLMNEPFYWAFCWASGLVLSQFILTNRELFYGKNVIDFGCGSGVVAIAAAIAGADNVIACDIDPIAIKAARANAQLNNVSLNYANNFENISAEIDVIIVADVLYDRGNYHWLKRFRERAKQVFIADSRVKNFNFPGYQMMDTFEAITLPDLEESSQFRRVNLYQALSSIPSN